MKKSLAVAVLGLVGIALAFLLWSGGEERQERGATGPGDSEVEEPRAAAALETPDAAPSAEASATRAALAVEARAPEATPLAVPDRGAGEAAIDVHLVSQDTGAGVAGIRLMVGLVDQKADEVLPAENVDGPVGGVWKLPRTDDEGRATFLVEAQRSYELYILGNQGIDATHEAFEAPAAGERLTLRIDVRTAEDIVFVGRVVDSDTEVPLAGASIGLLESRDLQPTPVTTSDVDGLFRLTGRSWAPRTYRVDHAGYGWLIIQPTAGHATVGEAKDVRLRRGALVRAELTEASGVPAAEREVRLSTDPYYMRPKEAAFHWWSEERPAWSAITGTDGVGLIENTPAGIPLNVDVLEDGDLVYRYGDFIQLVPGEERVLTIQLGAGCTIEGRAVSDTGSVSGVPVWLLVATWRQPVRYLQSYEHAELVAETITDASGAFRFEDVGPGDWWIGASPRIPGDDRPAPLAELVTITEGDAQKEVTLPIHRDLYIRGRLLDAQGQPVTSGYVIAAHGSGGDVREGAFEVGPLAPGDYELTGMGGGVGNDARSEPVTATAGAKDVVIRLRPGGTIAGYTRVAGRGKPETAIVTLVPADQKKAGMFMTGGAPTEGGAFHFRSLVPGTYHVRAMDTEGNAGCLRDVSVEPGEVREDVVVELLPGGRLELVLENREGVDYFVRVYQDDLPVAISGGGETVTILPGTARVDLTTFDMELGEAVVVETREVTVHAGEKLEVRFDAQYDQDERVDEEQDG